MSNQNATNFSLPDFPLRRMHFAWYKLFIATMFLLAAFGAALNVLLFSAIVSSRKLRSGSGTLIAHSIFLETIICAFVLPFLTAIHWASLYYAPTKNICRAALGAFYTAVWGFNWSSLFLAANRFAAVCFPSKYAACVTKRCLLAAISFSWSIATGCMVGLTLDTVASLEENRMWGGCSENVRQPQVHGILTSLGTSVPAVLEGLLYGCLFVVPLVRKSFRVRAGVADVSASNDAHQKRSEVIRRRRQRKTLTVFAAYLWSEACFMFGPISFSVGRGNVGMMELAPLLAPALILLGYATSPVSSPKYRVVRKYREIISSIQLSLNADLPMRQETGNFLKMTTSN